jgi:hypothetical protein
VSKPIPLSQTTLRDHYAAVSLQACIGRLPLLTTQPNGLADGGDLGGLVVSPEDRGRVMRGMARAAYGYADAMLAIRDGEP